MKYFLCPSFYEIMTQQKHPADKPQMFTLSVLICIPKMKKCLTHNFMQNVFVLIENFNRIG